jgi:rhodanese-related sulfurtransferase
MSNVHSEPREDVTPAEVHELHDQGGIVVVDVREEYEWEAGRITGSRHVPLGTLAAQAESIPRDAEVIFVCRTGSRSAMATTAFRTAGWSARNMVGGLEAWAGAGLPLEPEGAVVA